jgi:elongation factor Ts
MYHLIPVVLLPICPTCLQWLRKKGLAGADKKAGRLAAEGVIAAYIHPGSRLGVLLEVNCETDFVAASDKFNALVNSIAMQIAASPSVSPLLDP